MNKEKKDAITSKAKIMFNLLGKHFEPLLKGSVVDYANCPQKTGTGECNCDENLMAIIAGLGVFTNLLGTMALNDDVLTTSDLAFVEAVTERGVRSEVMRSAIPEGADFSSATQQLAEQLLGMLKQTLEQPKQQIGSKASTHDVTDPNVQ